MLPPAVTAIKGLNNSTLVHLRVWAFQVVKTWTGTQSAVEARVRRMKPVSKAALTATCPDRIELSHWLSSESGDVWGARTERRRQVNRRGATRRYPCLPWNLLPTEPDAFPEHLQISEIEAPVSWRPAGDCWISLEVTRVGRVVAASGATIGRHQPLSLYYCPAPPVLYSSWKPPILKNCKYLEELKVAQKHFCMF